MIGYSAVHATSPDLRAFKMRGGRLMMLSGWADPIGPPLDAVEYYTRVEEAWVDVKTQNHFSAAVARRHSLKDARFIRRTSIGK